VNAIDTSISALTRAFKRNAGWSFLRSKNAPLAAAFFFSEFLSPGKQTIREEDAAISLSKLVSEAASEFPDMEFRSSGAASYLNDWVESEKWLRRKYVDGAYFLSLSPDVEKSIRWIEDALGEKDFVGTESRLATMYGLLREIVFETETDPDTRLLELKRKRDELDAEISRIESGGKIAVMDDFRIKDRMQQFEKMSRELLSDFGSVEENFRTLAKNIRKSIAENKASGGSKGRVFEELFESREKIDSSEQGKSFRAFFRFFDDIREDFADCLRKVLRIPSVAGTNIDPGMGEIHSRWYSSAASVRETVSGMAKHLESFIESVNSAESRRIGELLNEAEKKFLRLADFDGIFEKKNFSHIDSTSPEFVPFASRPLFRPSDKNSVIRMDIEEEDVSSITMEKLLSIEEVDRKRVAANMKKRLSEGAFSIGEFFAEKPPEHGLEEIIHCLVLAGKDMETAEDGRSTETIRWLNGKGILTTLEIPKITVLREKKQSPRKTPARHGEDNDTSSSVERRVS